MARINLQSVSVLGSKDIVVNTFKPPRASPIFLAKGNGVPFPAVKLAGRDVKNSAQSRAEKKRMHINTSMPIPVAARSKAWVYGRSLTGIVGSNPAYGMDVWLL
jgi:hypothetical protein